MYNIFSLHFYQRCTLLLTITTMRDLWHTTLQQLLLAFLLMNFLFLQNQLFNWLPLLWVLIGEDLVTNLFIVLLLLLHCRTPLEFALQHVSVCIVGVNVTSGNWICFYVTIIAVHCLCTHDRTIPYLVLGYCLRPVCAWCLEIILCSVCACMHVCVHMSVLVHVCTCVHAWVCVLWSVFPW